MELIAKLAILADAAKYDASCASSGAGGRNARDSRTGKGMGSTESMGICHSYTPDGRCISLLKILLTNFCLFECSYCVNRSSSGVPRARLSVDEVVQLTLDFYRRNYIEGLFLSSGIIQSPDYTMEQVIEVARRLREQHDFRGYIHLKTIPDADPALIEAAGRYADRISINVELPTASGLKTLAPEKDWEGIRRTMQRIRTHRDSAMARLQQDNRDSQRIHNLRPRSRREQSLQQRLALPAGQSTQMIVGADTADDRTILSTAADLYQRFDMRRVYYSAFSPIPDASSRLPLQPAPLLREHRLYQADWLMRFYGYDSGELVAPASPAGDGMLDLDVDPKLAWALRNPDFFPVDINRASRDALLRVPGIGPRNADRIVEMRRQIRLSLSDLRKLRVPVQRCEAFIVAHGSVRPPPLVLPPPRATQLSLF